LKDIALRIATLSHTAALTLKEMGYSVVSDHFFDTVMVKVEKPEIIRVKALEQDINLRYTSEGYVGFSIDETTSTRDLFDLINCFTNESDPVSFTISNLQSLPNIPAGMTRQSAFLQHPVFNTHRSESQMMRYIKYLENKDLSLNTSMISLGSCTMKLNAASEMMPLSSEYWNRIHPFAPSDQTMGYKYVIDRLSEYLCAITAFDACSLQPNSGAQGEYAGLLTIRDYHASRGDHHRSVMLIPISAHGTNPASAVMAGMKVVVVKALDNGYIDVDDLKAKAEQYSHELAGIMITYPSTYGVYEETVKVITDIIHAHGGQVYMDGANMNAQVGLARPGDYGADVSHLNLHKTFCIPHGGGGPGVGPVAVRSHLAPYLPSHPVIPSAGPDRDSSVTGPLVGPVSSAPYGSANILTIPWSYISMMGPEGLERATHVAILNANYVAKRLKDAFPILYTGRDGLVAHECILDLRPITK
jgi:glycine dehydrogenase